MEIQQYLQDMKLIQNNIISFLDNEGDVSDSFQDLVILFDEKQMHHHQHKIKSILHLLSRILSNHHRSANFYNKIMQLFQKLEHRIKHFFPHNQLFDIFKGNKRILLYLIQEDYIKVDIKVASVMLSEKYSKYFYPEFFYPELKSFMDSQQAENISKELDKDFESKRKTGENDNYLCELIRNDFIHEFIDHSIKTKLSLQTVIKPSKYETNNFLLKNEPSLIEYSAFCGSVEIFKYLFDQKGVKKKSAIWLYAIHGQNAEIIHHLKENHFKIKPKNFDAWIVESIKCHHNEIANFIIETFVEDAKYAHVDTFPVALHFYNFYFIQNDFNTRAKFYDLCKYDYYPIVKFLLETKDVYSPHRKSIGRSLFVSFVFIFNEISFCFFWFK